MKRHIRRRRLLPTRTQAPAQAQGADAWELTRRKKVDRGWTSPSEKPGVLHKTADTDQSAAEMFQSDLLSMEGGEGSGPAVLGSFPVGVEGGMGGMGMGIEERVAVGMERMAECLLMLEARVEELEARLSVKSTVAVVAPVSTPVKTAVKTEKTAPPAPVKTVAKKEKTAAAPVAAVPILTGKVPLDAPTPASYRLAPSVVAAHTKCQARKEPPQGGSGKGWDKRYTPSVFWEQVCNGDQETEGLCSTCLRYRDQNPKKWHGLITEDPLATSHMLGTAWAAKCKWTGSGSSSAPVSSAASVVSVEESGQAAAPVSAATVAPMEATVAKKVRAPRKKKEAAAAPAPVAAVAVVTVGTAVVTPAAVSTAEPVADAGELRMLQGEFYWVVGSSVYEYDQIEERPGDYVGRVRADETIDGDAEEEGAEESDGE